MAGIGSCKKNAHALTTIRGTLMATNPPSGDGHRNGAVKNRSQVKSPLNNKETKRDDTSGKFMAQKKTGKFKGVRREN